LKGRKIRIKIGDLVYVKHKRREEYIREGKNIQEKRRIYKRREEYTSEGKNI